MTKIVLLFFLILLLSPKSAFAAEGAPSCDNRYVTIVNPVRKRKLWFDKSLQPIIDQYRLIHQNKFAATWLLQDDVFSDTKLVEEIERFNNKQELGVLLEISEDTATRAQVLYPAHTSWHNPKAVFLSGYSLSERRRLIDHLFRNFKHHVGYYPRSVGAWWIDSYSLDYMKGRYGITSALIVADQKTTDNYGIWGQWWGVAYYPTRANILTPASTQRDQVHVVITQWAQRDLTQAYGFGPSFSNYSLQANDYIRQGKDTSYFAQLIHSYLDCSNKLGQITVGLETGIESFGYIDEYENQLDYIKKIDFVEPLTMSEFSDRFRNVYPTNPEKYILKDSTSEWVLTIGSRSNKKLNDEIFYDRHYAFADMFVPDKNDFLKRDLSTVTYKEHTFSIPIFPIVPLVILAVFLAVNKFIFGLSTTLYLLAGYGYILKAKNDYGWEVFFGPAFPVMQITQILFCLIAVAVMFIWYWLIVKFIKNHNKDRLILFLLPLSYSVDPIIQLFRFTIVEGRYHVGFLTTPLHFIGISISKAGISYVVRDFPHAQASALLKIDINNIIPNFWINILFSIFSHFIFGLILLFIYNKIPRNMKKIFIAVLAILFTWHLCRVIASDPSIVLPLS